MRNPRWSPEINAATLPWEGDRKMLTVHGDPFSGNCYKVGLLLALLGEPFRWVDVNVLKGETRTPAFLAMNPNGRVPVLEIEPGTVLAESNAIICYLAE